MSNTQSKVTAIAADHYQDPLFQAACQAIAHAYFTDRILEARNINRLLGNLLTRGKHLELNEAEMHGLALVFDQIDERLTQ